MTPTIYSQIFLQKQFKYICFIIIPVLSDYFKKIGFYHLIAKIGIKWYLKVDLICVYLNFRKNKYFSIRGLKKKNYSMISGKNIKNFRTQ